MEVCVRGARGPRLFCRTLVTALALGGSTILPLEQRGRAGDALPGAAIGVQTPPCVLVLWAEPSGRGRGTSSSGGGRRAGLDSCWGTRNSRADFGVKCRGETVTQKHQKQVSF